MKLTKEYLLTFIDKLVTLAEEDMDSHSLRDCTMHDWIIDEMLIRIATRLYEEDKKEQQT